jgi:hypothetical protein
MPPCRHATTIQPSGQVNTAHLPGFRREQMRDSLASGQPGFFRDSESLGFKGMGTTR